MFSPSPCPGHYSRRWATMASADFCILTLPISQRGAISYRFLSAFFICTSQTGGTVLVCAGIFVSRNPTGDFTGKDLTLHGIQTSPDKNVNFPCVAAPFTVSPVPWASTCCAALPRDSALYDVSVRQLASLHSGFLQTPPHGDALGVYAYLPSVSN